MLGGEVTVNGGAFGRDTTAMLSNYIADFAFIGAGAISSAPWLMDYSREEGELHRVVLNPPVRLPLLPTTASSIG